MRRTAIWVGALVAALPVLALSAVAQAAPPGLGPTSATNLQGISALAVGSVNPEGLPTTYHFEYGTSPSFAGAGKTPPTSAGAGDAAVAARAQLSNLSPDTTYQLRLVASNSQGTTTGTTTSFTTTHGFGLLAGEDGFAARVHADGGAAATQIGSHP